VDAGISQCKTKIFIAINARFAVRVDLAMAAQLDYFGKSLRGGVDLSWTPKRPLMEATAILHSGDGVAGGDMLTQLHTPYMGDELLTEYQTLPLEEGVGVCHGDTGDIDRTNGAYF
jgi:hypothetical protein